MGLPRWVVVAAGTMVVGIPMGLMTGCGLGFDVPARSPQLTAARKAAVEHEVRQFAATVSRDITVEGPAAWEKHFEDSPAFFMASEGKLAFPDRPAASEAIEELKRTIQHLELSWGDDLRVDPLTPEFAVVASSWHEVQSDKQGHQTTESGFFTGLVERRNGQWQFRDAHWSVAAPAAKAK